FFLVALLPAWLSFYRHRGAYRFLVSFVVSAGLGLAVLGALLWLHGELPPSLPAAWAAFDWQPGERPGPGPPGFVAGKPSRARGPGGGGLGGADVHRVDGGGAAGRALAKPEEPRPRHRAVGGGPDQHPVLVRGPGRVVPAVVPAVAAAADVPAEPDRERAARA